MSLSRNRKSPTVALAAARTLSSSSSSIPSSRGIASVVILLNSLVRTSAIALRVSKSSLPCKTRMHSNAESLSPSISLARHNTTLLETSCEGSAALRIRICGIPRGSINSFLSKSNLHHSISSFRRSSPLFSNCSIIHFAASAPAS